MEINVFLQGRSKTGWQDASHIPCIGTKQCLLRATAGETRHANNKEERGEVDFDLFVLNCLLYPTQCSLRESS
jgi:hypothetical protein